jgi:hypothetical protein
VFVVLGMLLLGAAAPARADRTVELIRALGDPSWRVRLQAAVVLGKLRDPRAVPWLTRALSDPDENVRSVAVTALAEIGEPETMRSIERLRSDPSSMVRQRVLAAIQKLQTPPPTIPSKAKAVFVAVGGIGSKAKKAPPEMTGKLRELITRELAKSPGVTLEGKPLSGFLIDSSITMLNKQVTREWVEYTCEISLIVGRLPDKSMVMMTSGGATVQVPRVGIKPEAEAGMQVDALEGAVKGAHQNLLAFIKAQNGG